MVITLNSDKFKLWEESDVFHTGKPCPVLELHVDLAFMYVQLFWQLLLNAGLS